MLCESAELYPAWFCSVAAKICWTVAIACGATALTVAAIFLYSGDDSELRSFAAFSWHHVSCDSAQLQLIEKMSAFGSRLLIQRRTAGSSTMLLFCAAPPNPVK